MSDFRHAACIRYCKLWHIISLICFSLASASRGLPLTRQLRYSKRGDYCLRWAEGPLPELSPPPLFSASIFHLRIRCRGNTSTFSNKHSGGLLKKDAMTLIITSESIQKTTKCSSGFKCLTDETHPCCVPASPVIEGYGLFVQTARQHSCPYSMSFGNGFICNCPSRYEIFLRYKR